MAPYNDGSSLTSEENVVRRRSQRTKKKLRESSSEEENNPEEEVEVGDEYSPTHRSRRSVSYLSFFFNVRLSVVSIQSF